MNGEIPNKTEIPKHLEKVDNSSGKKRLKIKQEFLRKKSLFIHNWLTKMVCKLDTMEYSSL